MIAVIQCAGSKRPDAGYFLNERGTEILFVAAPARAASGGRYVYARPDDQTGSGTSWRDELVRYNQSGNNPYGLSRAYELYVPPIYSDLVDKVGLHRTYILSAGWGLVRADYLIPNYDITFSQSVKKSDPFKFRHKSNLFLDFQQLRLRSSEPVFFFGGKDYVPLFCSLTDEYAGNRTVFFNSGTPPIAPGCFIEPFNHRAKTNWHYICARKLSSSLD